MHSQLQFSIAFILMATFAAAIACAAVVAQPSWQSLVTLHCLSVFFTTTSIISACQTTGKLRMFWIGVAVALAVSIVSTGAMLNWILSTYGAYSDELRNTAAKLARSQRVILPTIWCGAIANGCFVVAVYSLFFSQRKAPRD